MLTTSPSSRYERWVTDNEKTTRYDRAEADCLVVIVRTRRVLRREAGRAALGDDQLVDRLGLQLEAALDRIVELECADPLRDAFDRMREIRRKGRPGPDDTAQSRFVHMHQAFEVSRRRSERELARWEDDGGVAR